MEIRKGDLVQVIAGKSKGHKGRIKAVVPLKNRVIVEGANWVKKVSVDRRSQTRDFIELEAPLHRSNVMLVCPNCKQTTRVGHKILPNGKSIRACKKCGEMVDKA
ncbi:MAG TPA: 50S ribosomal protein L24 [Caldisericia bacterium]|nr:50S ribosomal protein L24 [Caldisericia bacterium]